MEESIRTEEARGSKGKKVLLIGLGLAATGTLAYFGYQWWQGQRETIPGIKDEEGNFFPPTENNFLLPSAPTRNDEFPLKKGSKGTRVKQLQEALLQKHGSEILPKYGADGDFGSETAVALAKENYPASIDENTFTVMVQGAGLDAGAVAKELYNAAVKKDFSASLKSLQKLKSKEDYSSVSDIFKSAYRIGGVRQTLVNGMLNSFSDEKQKQAIRLQFTRMGLSYDGKTWTLSGLNTMSLITKRPSLVWANPKEAIQVPQGMVLGKEISRRGVYTLFENDGRHFLVRSETVETI